MEIKLNLNKELSNDGLFWFLCYLLHRDGFTFTPGIDGLQTSGRGRQMEKAVSTRSLVMFSLATSKRDGDTETFFVSMLMGLGIF